jgi:hypothetical protein
LVITIICMNACKSKIPGPPASQPTNGPNLFKEYGKENFQAYRYLDFTSMEGKEPINSDSLTYPCVLRYKKDNEHIPVIFFFKEWKYMEYIFHKGNGLYYSKSERFSGIGPGSNDIFFIYPDSIVEFYLSCVDSACNEGFIRSKKMISNKSGCYINYMSMDAGIGYDGYKYSGRDLLNGQFMIDEDHTIISSDLVHSEKSTFTDSAEYKIEQSITYVFNDSLKNFEPWENAISYYNPSVYYRESWFWIYWINRWELYMLSNSYGPEFTREVLNPY